MKTFKGLKLSDQKIMVENLFTWDVENGDKPNRNDYKKWVLAFFESESDMDTYISDLYSDIELSDGDPYFTDLNNSYTRQIEFLKNLRGIKNI
ncbi:hypothetical protein DSECCO2_649990 [anaerobic digester metagenome]